MQPNVFSLEDLQSFCDDLSNWILELGFVDELQKAFPKGNFPLKVDEDENLQEGLDVLVYLTLWMCLKNQSKAPPHLESRVLLSNGLKGPWQILYIRLCNKLDQKITVSEMFDLAG